MSSSPAWPHAQRHYAALMIAHVAPQPPRLPAQSNIAPPSISTSHVHLHFGQRSGKASRFTV